MLNIAGATDEPLNNWFEGLAIDPGRRQDLLGERNGEDKISCANLNGSGGGDLDTAGSDGEQSIRHRDRSCSRAGSTGPNRGATAGIAFANLPGGSGGESEPAGATTEEPAGLAIDKAGGGIYWGNYDANTISFANLNGTGGGDLNTAGATVDEPFGVAIDPHRRSGLLDERNR